MTEERAAGEAAAPAEVDSLRQELRRSQAELGAMLARCRETPTPANATLVQIAGRTAHLGGWSVDLARNQVLWSDEVAAIHERPPGYMLSLEEGISYYAPEWRERMAAVFGACAHEGRPFDEEMELITARGRRIWVRAVGEAIRDESGAIASVQGAFQDITDHKRGELVMAARMRLLRGASGHSLAELLRGTLDEAEALTNSQVGFCHFVDPDQTTLSLQVWSTNTTQQMCKAQGAGSHYPLHQAGVWVDCIHERRPVIHNDYASLPHRKGLPAGHAPVIRELVVPVLRDSRIVAVLGVGNKATDYDERDVKSVADLADLAWDIAQRKRAEEERAALDNRLQQARKMEAVGQLAGGVAHEFNNKLMGIMGYVELCRDEVPPGHPLRGYLDEITAEAQRSADIVRQLLAFAREQTIAPTLLDLNQVLSGTLAMLRQLLGEDINLAWIPGAGLWKVEMDGAQLDQILTTLATNARDAIGGEGRVTVETRNAVLDPAYCAEHAEATPGDYVMVEVSDTGCGMRAETLEHLFEPFYTTKGLAEGTGLGLATIYGIVRQNHGSITVATAPGQGTTFRIYLPRAATAG